MTTPSQNGRSHILVVDDDPLSVRLAALLLGSEGYTVTTAGSGIAALSAIADAPPAARPTVILVDLKMPGLSGAELVKRLRLEAGSGVRILGMSAKEPLSAEPFDGFLLKPIDIELLGKMLATSDVAPREAAKECAGHDLGVLNQAVFARLETMMSWAAVGEVFAACLKDVRRRIPGMLECVESADRAGLQRAAHTIRGGSAMIGAARLSQIAAQIEAGKHAPGEDGSLVKELSTACDELERILLERNAAKRC